MKTKLSFRIFILSALVLGLSSCAAMKSGGDSPKKYVGDWEYKVEELPIDIDGTFVVDYQDGVYTVLLITPMGDLALDDVTIEKGVLNSTFNADGNFGEIGGTFTGDQFDGSLLVQGNEFVMKATRKK